jgi:hypothetical protein
LETNNGVLCVEGRNEVYKIYKEYPTEYEYSFKINPEYLQDWRGKTINLSGSSIMKIQEGKESLYISMMK